MGCLEGSGVPVLYKGRTVPTKIRSISHYQHFDEPPLNYAYSAGRDTKYLASGPIYKQYFHVLQLTGFPVLRKK
jgi:hypothetical protein